jgi:hypothetical protein
MQSHIRILGILHIVLGALGALAGLAVLLIFGGIAGFVGANVAGEAGAEAQAAAPIVAMVGGAIAVFLLFVSLPGIIAGIGLLHYREWARILTIVLSAFDLLNVPLGTMLGVYGLWVLLQKETADLFANPPNRIPSYS